jgi:hypothetical protein
MGTGETRGEIPKVETASRGKRPKRRVGTNIHRGHGPRKSPYFGTLQSPSVRRIRAPFFLTKMRDLPEGRTQMWLWSLRDKEWVVDQELYLGQGSQMPLARKVIRAHVGGV